jgi:Cys-tRNA(Pro) deacylase
MSGSPTNILSDKAISIGFHLQPNPDTRGAQFINASGVKSTRPDEPLFYLIEQTDPEVYRGKLDPNMPKTKGLEDTLDISQHHIIKSLMFYDVKTRSPCCILMHGDCTVNTRAVAKMLNTKSVQPLPIEEANAASGYIVGGTSGFGLKTPMPIIIQSTIFDLDWIIINGGQHYKYILMRPEYFLPIFESEHSKSLGFTVHVGLVGKQRSQIIVVENVIDVIDDKKDGKDNVGQLPQQIPQTQTPQKTPSAKFESNFDEYNAMVQLKHELSLITSAYDQNNITNSHILSNTEPRDYLLLLQPSSYISKLINDKTQLSEGSTGLNPHLVSAQVNLDVHHWMRITLPLYSTVSPNCPQSPLPHSPHSPHSPRADIRTVLLKFECVIGKGYPFKPVQGIKLSCDSISDFYSLFDIDHFGLKLTELANKSAENGTPSLLSLFEFINENYSIFLRQNKTNIDAVSSGKSSVLFGSDLSPYSDSSYNANNTTPHNTKIVSPLQQEFPTFSKHASNNPTLCDDFYTNPLVPSQVLKPELYIDAVEFCAEHLITTVHPAEIWKYLLNGTFSIQLLDELTPEQRFAIYHIPLLGRIVKTRARGSLYDNLVQEMNKIKEKMNLQIPEIISSTLNITNALQFNPNLTLSDLIRQAYMNDIVLQKLSPIQLVQNDSSNMLQISKDARHVNLKSGEEASFIQKKHGSIKVGLVGLPNCGKSSLYNVLTNLSVPASNFAFCTIDPNLCRLPIVDQRFSNLVKHTKKALSRGLAANQTVPIQPPDLSVVDIAGIVAKASIGKGLGNAFLHHISTVHVIYQVVRLFDDVMDSSIEHVENSVNPIRDIEIIHQELIEKDLEQFYKRIARMNQYGKIARWLPPKEQDENDFQLSVLLKAHSWLLLTNKPLRYCHWDERESAFLATLQTWTSKPVCYVLNMSIYQYCDTIRRENLIQTFFDYFRLQGIFDITITPICIVYEQARVLYQKRFVPFIGHKVDLLEQFRDVLSPLSPSVKEQGAIVVPDTTITQTREMYTMAALGREIQAYRLDFDISVESLMPEKRMQSVAPTTAIHLDDKRSKGKDSKKVGKKDAKKDSKKSSKFESVNNDLDFGGGFGDFLTDADVLPAQTTHHGSKLDKKDAKKDKSIPSLQLSTEQPTKTDSKPKFTAPNHDSNDFWSRINDYLKTTPRLHSILKQIVRDEENNTPLILPPADQKTAIPDQFPNEDRFDIGIDDFGGGVENTLDDAQSPETDPNSQKNENVSPNQTSEDLLNQVKGKVLFLDTNNPTPLAQLIISACKLARVSQFFIANSQFIKGIMVPRDVTTAQYASLRLSRDIYDNFHSCEVIHYQDFIDGGYSMAKVRENGKILTQNKNYIVQDGDILTFKRTKQGKATSTSFDEPEQSGSNVGKKKHSK